MSTALPEIPVSIAPPDWNNRRLFGLLWPLILEQLLVVTMGIADTVMVSFVGEFAVSGVSLVDNINILTTTVFTGITTGGAVVTSQYIGSRNRKNTIISARQLVYVCVLISLVMMILTLPLRRYALRLIYGNIADDVMQAAQIYFFITALSYPFLALYSCAAALFRCMGNSRVTMRIALLVNIVNIGGNAIFIYGLGLGVVGAAAATFIGRFVSAFVLILMLMRDNSGIINLKGITKVSFEPAMIKRIFNIGVPNSLESSMFQFGKIIIARIFTAFGTAAIAANAVTSTINSMAFMPGNAFGMGLLIIAGQYMGAGDHRGAKRYTGKILAISYIFYLCINIFIFVFMNQIIGIFKLSGEANEMCVSFLRVHCVTSTLFWCLSFVLPYALKAAGDAHYVMIVASCTMWIVRVSAAFILAFPVGLGPVAVWIAMGADFFFRSIFFVARWFSGRWKEKRVI
jgi:putative MATE family efflux protein